LVDFVIVMTNNTDVASYLNNAIDCLRIVAEYAAEGDRPDIISYIRRSVMDAQRVYGLVERGLNVSDALLDLSCSICVAGEKLKDEKGDFYYFATDLQKNGKELGIHRDEGHLKTDLIDRRSLQSAQRYVLVREECMGDQWFYEQMNLRIP
jgi:hypothetical protein